MRILLTGASGFIGSHLVPELLQAGHRVTGLTRHELGVETLKRLGAEGVRGDVNDLGNLCRIAGQADGIIHTAFNHEFIRLREHSENDRRVIEALGKVIAGSHRPFIITSGTGLVRARPGRPARECDDHISSSEFARAATEEAADTLMESGARVLVMRLPQVHDTQRQGRISRHIQLARQNGRVAYLGTGLNRLPAVHVSDAARLYRLALEHGRPGARYHAVAEEGIALRDIAEVIGAGLKLPVESITAAEASGYFGEMARLASLDLAASSEMTRQELNWSPKGPDLLTDLRQMPYGMS